MALTTRTSTSVRGPQLLYVSMPLTTSQPDQVDIDALLVFIVAGWKIITGNGVSASLAHYTLAREVNTPVGA